MTTILSVLAKPLVPWASKQAAICAMEEDFSHLTKADALKYIAGASNRVMNEASAIGTHVHDWVDAYCRQTSGEGERPPHMDLFRKWIADYNVTVLMSEVTIYNRKHGYAGSFDLYADVDGIRTLIDVKTGNNVYAEVALQLAAYANGEFRAQKELELTMPPIQAAAVLHLRPLTYRFLPVSISHEAWQTFLYCKELYRWKNYTSKNVFQREDEWQSLKSSSVSAQPAVISTTTSGVTATTIQS